MKRLCLIPLLAAAACSSPTSPGTSPCVEQKAWPSVSAAGDTSWVSNRNPPRCVQSTFGTAGQP